MTPSILLLHHNPILGALFGREMETVHGVSLYGSALFIMYPGVSRSI